MASRCRCGPRSIGKAGSRNRRISARHVSGNLHGLCWPDCIRRDCIRRDCIRPDCVGSQCVGPECVGAADPVFYNANAIETVKKGNGWRIATRSFGGALRPPRARRKPSALPKCISAQRLIPTGLTQFEMTSRLRVLRWSFCENSYPRPIPRSVVPQIETRTERSCHPQKSYFSKLIRSVCDLLDTSRLRGR